MRGFLFSLKCRRSDATFGGKNMKRLLPYALLVAGMPLMFTMGMHAVPDAPGSGKWIYVFPFLNLAMFGSALPAARYKRWWLHLMAGMAATPILFFCNVMVFGWMAIMRSGLAGTQ